MTLFRLSMLTTALSANLWLASSACAQSEAAPTPTVQEPSEVIQASFNTAEKPNLIMVVLRDIGYGDLGCNGHPYAITPNLDKWATQGAVFDRCYSTAPYGSATFASALIGRDAYRGNVAIWGGFLRPQEVTLAESLRDKGHETGMFGIWQIGSVVQSSPVSPKNQGFNTSLVAFNQTSHNPYLCNNGAFAQAQGQSGEVITNGLIRFLQDHHNQNKPFFAVLYPPGGSPPFNETPKTPTQYSSRQNRPYYNEITALDEQLGRLQNTLDALKLTDKTLICVIGTNGSLQQNDRVGQGIKNATYEGGIRIPAMMIWPGKIKPRRIPSATSVLDFHATLSNLYDLPKNQDRPYDGKDLTAALLGQANRHSPILVYRSTQQRGAAFDNDKIIAEMMEAQHAFEPNPRPDLEKRYINRYTEYDDGSFPGNAVYIDWPWKLHRDQKGNNVDRRKFLLFNLEDDPLENNNLLSLSPGTKAIDLPETLVEAVKLYAPETPESTSENTQESTTDKPAPAQLSKEKLAILKKAIAMRQAMEERLQSMQDSIEGQDYPEDQRIVP